MSIYWNNMAERLGAELRRFERDEWNEPLAMVLSSSDQLLQRAKEREQSTRAVIDAAIRVFAQGMPWPELSDDERFFLARRLHYGLLLAESFSPERASHAELHGASLFEDDERAILEWLLIDLWSTLGFPIWLETQVQYYGRCFGDATVGNSAALYR